VPNKKNKKKKKGKQNTGRLFGLRSKRLDPNKIVLGVFSALTLMGATVLTDIQGDCRDAEQQIVQAQQDNPGTEIRYIGIGGVVCSIADPGGGSSGGWGP
jgi:hypothetical protein